MQRKGGLTRSGALALAKRFRGSKGGGHSCPPQPMTAVASTSQRTSGE